MKRNILFFALSFCTLILFTRCDDDDPIELTQAMIDNVSELALTETGGDFPHGGMDLTGDETIREIFTENGRNVGNANKGTVVTKHTYAKNADGSKGDLLVSFVMLKHEEGYWEDSNDWEYVMIPADPSVDYALNPNGLLANATVSGNVFDMNPGCVGCHNGAEGGDQLFHND